MGHNIAEIYVDGMEVGVARNEAAKKAIESGMKYLMFIDWDTIVPREALCRLVYHLDNHPEYDVAAGLYCSKSDPPWPMLWREWGNGVSWDFTLGEVLTERVVGVPMGCTLIRVSVFERLLSTLENPWFKTVSGTIDDGSGPVPEGGTEDLWFCQRLDGELHGKILMDTGILCDHIDHSTGLRHTLPDDCLPRQRAKEAADKRKIVLHVGCGPRTAGQLPPQFDVDNWREVRLDIDKDAKPDIVASITDMRKVASESVTAVWSSHNIEHLCSSDVEAALKEFYRVLLPGGVAFIQVPDIQAVAEEIVKGNFESAAYESPAGPVCPIDMLYGYRKFVDSGCVFQQHKTGFTADSLRQKLENAGFNQIEVERHPWSLLARAHRAGNS
jgi:SAM-dependent methyltransferase